MIYTIKQSVVREKDGTLSEVLYEGASLNCSSNKALHSTIKDIEIQNPEWKRVKFPFIPKKHWAYIEVAIYIEDRLKEAYYYYVI